MSLSTECGAALLSFRYASLISVKTRPKEEQRYRSTRQWYQRRTDQMNNNLLLHAVQVKPEQHSLDRPSLEVKEEQIATRLRRNEAAKYNLNGTWTGNVPGWRSISITFHTFHTLLVEDSRFEQNRVRARLYNCRVCVCKSNVEIRMAGDNKSPQWNNLDKFEYKATSCYWKFMCIHFSPWESVRSPRCRCSFLDTLISQIAQIPHRTRFS